jgi:hypothetical protein
MKKKIFMKELKLVLFCFLLVFLVFELSSNKDRDTLVGETTETFTYVSTNPQRVHESVNEFVDLVSEKLKNESGTLWGIKISKITGTFEIKNNMYEINLKATFTKCNAAESFYFFDHRGTMLSGTNQEKAFENVEKQLSGTNKVQDMIDGFEKTYDNHVMTDEMVLTMYAKNNNTHWCIKEFFCAARR